MKLEPGAHVTPNVRLVRPLGEGGMGAVWVAEHLGLGTEVAVKFLQGAYADDAAARSRFSREAAASAQVKSSHVVRVYDHGLTDTQVPFIVMELLEGTDLSKRIESERTLAPAEVVAIVSQLCKALEQAHEKGVVHRDIKPENIFLTSEGGELFVKLLDFGIAKTEVLSKKTTGSRNSTLAGETLGTPFYMSPEQFKDSKKIDLRSDLYSLGVVVYEALTGHLPFNADTLAALAIAVNDGEYTAPSEVNATLPKTLDAWFAKACARAPADRFASARELSDALRTALGVSTAVSSQSGPYAAASPSSGRQVVVSHVDPVEAEAMSLRETAFATSGGGKTPSLSTTREAKRWPLIVAAVAGLGLIGGLAMWKLRPTEAASTTGDVSSAHATPSAPPSVGVSPTTSGAQPIASAVVTASSTPTAPSAPVSAARTSSARPTPSAPPSASARPKGTGNDRDIW
jgi:serine/threonine-protein kinase